jgi:hypothetical protein
MVKIFSNERHSMALSATARCTTHIYTFTSCPHKPAVNKSISSFVNICKPEALTINNILLFLTLICSTNMKIC